ncbi:MAG: D-alanyl-D-alanine carboxypeptidase family protein [Selenomonas sp.]|nr:D-alanyl-D-alanine carboxypeptidase [Selenomonadales bacterium]MDY5717576.1 D-alanyl-D-alanine carboxypeptidase family protein [Selenomonas sp.]
MFDSNFRKKNKLITFFMIFLLIFIPNASVLADDTEAFDLKLTAQSAILIEASTGRVIWEKDADVRHYPASMTKMMTGILALEKLLPKADVVISPNAAATEDCPLEIVAGECLSADNIITGMLMESDNGAAVAIAEAVDGSVSQFVQRMNERAQEIGMSNTHFVNPNGLTEANHYSTARDMAKLARFAMNNKKFREIVSTKKQVIHWEVPARQQKLAENTNKLLANYNGMNGIKTGWTKAAGGCLAASARRNGVELIAIVMQTPGPDDRFADASKLLDYGFKQVKMVKGIAKDRVSRKLWVRGGTSASVMAHPAEDINYPLINGEDPKHYTLSYDVPKVIAAPLKDGETVGRIIIKYDNKEVGSVPMISEKVEAGFSIGSWLVGIFAGLLEKI